MLEYLYNIKFEFLSNIKFAPLPGGESSQCCNSPNSPLRPSLMGGNVSCLFDLKCRFISPEKRHAEPQLDPAGPPELVRGEPRLDLRVGGDLHTWRTILLTRYKQGF